MLHRVASAVMLVTSLHPKAPRSILLPITLRLGADPNARSQTRKPTTRLVRQETLQKCSRKFKDVERIVPSKFDVSGVPQTRAVAR